ncbi:MAG: dissimilatory sulfite reductase D family protein [Desulfurivibrio sp.]|nr:dissimilatory sulfite reductase D family protein [Desulfurivibrio sp.]
MALSIDELKEKIMEKALKGPKSQLYVKDFFACDPEAKPRAVKNVANDLVKEGRLVYWSSGSTTMYAAKERGQKEQD